MDRRPDVPDVKDTNHAVRCDHDGLKMAEIKGGHLILRAKHHGEIHVKIVSLEELRKIAGGNDLRDSPTGES